MDLSWRSKWTRSSSWSLTLLMSRSLTSTTPSHQLRSQIVTGSYLESSRKRSRSMSSSVNIDTMRSYHQRHPFQRKSTSTSIWDQMILHTHTVVRLTVFSLTLVSPTQSSTSCSTSCTGLSGASLTSFTLVRSLRRPIKFSHTSVTKRNKTKMRRQLLGINHRQSRS